MHLSTCDKCKCRNTTRPDFLQPATVAIPFLPSLREDGPPTNLPLRNRHGHHQDRHRYTARTAPTVKRRKSRMYGNGGLPPSAQAKGSSGLYGTHTAPGHSIPCHRIVYSAIPCHSVPCHTIHTIPYCSIPYHTYHITPQTASHTKPRATSCIGHPARPPSGERPAAISPLTARKLHLLFVPARATIP